MFQKLCVAALVALVLATRAFAVGTVTYSLDLTDPGQFTLYADASVGDNAGIAAWGVQLKSTGGQILTEDNLSPLGMRTNAVLMGFSDDRRPAPNLNTDINGIPLIPDDNTHASVYFFSGGQLVATGPTANFIYGFGQAAGSFAALYGANYSPANSLFVDGIADQSWHAHLRLASGTYTGALGFDIASMNYAALWVSNDRTRTNTPLAALQFSFFLGSAFSVDSTAIDNVNASNPGIVTGIVKAHWLGTTREWVDFGYNYFTSPDGTQMTGVVPPLPATFDSATQQFSWNTTGASPGTYLWYVKGWDGFGYGKGLISVHVTAVPEPAALSLLSLALIGGLGLRRRVSA